MQPLRFGSFSSRKPSSSRFTMSANRSPSFVWLRGFAATGVVILHACAAYLTVPMPGLTWAIQDRPCAGLNTLFWSIELFIMPLFLMMAGFFVLPLIQKHQVFGFLRHRGKRLLLPLIVFSVILLPLVFYTWMLGWLIEDRVTVAEVKRLKFVAGQDEHLWGLSHLWFLQYLFLYCVVFAAAYSFWPRRWRSATLREKLRRPSLVALAAISLAVLAVAPEVVFGFQHAFYPVPSKWLYSGCFFAGGIWLSVYDPQLRQVNRLCFRLLFVGGLAACVSLFAMRQALIESGFPLAMGLMLLATVVAAWSISLGLHGLAHRLPQRVPMAVQSFATASFWVYLVHHPLVGLSHISVKQLAPSAPAWVKLLVVTTITIAVCLASFHVFVRRTWLGLLLGVPQSPGNASAVATPRASDQQPEGVPRLLRFPARNPSARKAA